MNKNYLILTIVFSIFYNECEKDKPNNTSQKNSVICGSESNLPGNTVSPTPERTEDINLHTCSESGARNHFTLPTKNLKESFKKCTLTCKVNNSQHS